MLGYKAYSLGEYTITHQDFIMLIVERIYVIDKKKSNPVTSLEYNQMQYNFLVNLRILLGLAQTEVHKDIDDVMSTILFDYSPDRVLYFVNSNLGLFYLLYRNINKFSRLNEDETIVYVPLRRLREYKVELTKTLDAIHILNRKIKALN